MGLTTTFFIPCPAARAALFSSNGYVTDTINNLTWVADLSLFANKTYAEQLTTITNLTLSAPSGTTWHMATPSEMQKLQSYTAADIGRAFNPIRDTLGWDVFYGRHEYNIFQGVTYPESTLKLEFMYNPIWGFYTPLSTGVLGWATKSPVISAWVVASPTPAVPIPAAAWLLGSGLIGIVALKRRFHN